ncbi:hypothetical protein LTR27_001473 [Elasticomyces elasticus]|nr:hypothetical protein LTR27_001473 [Elasticomyces elasticus]
MGFRDRFSRLMVGDSSRGSSTSDLSNTANTVLAPHIGESVSIHGGQSKCVPEASSGPTTNGQLVATMLPVFTITDDIGVTGAGNLDNTLTTPKGSTTPAISQTPSQTGPAHGGAGSRFDTRLITVTRSNHSGLIHCTSQPIALRDDPDFAALSYHWGSGEADRDILLNGHKVRVRKTLYEALKMLLNQKMSDVWVDSLSIDQDNDEDKGQQVAKMHVIYSKATRVYAWLGPGNSDRDGTDGELGLKTLNKVPDDRTELTAWAQKQILAEQQKAVIGLINRDYWKRSWIIQELSKAREVRILCGHQRADLKVFLDNLFDLNSCMKDTLVPTATHEHFTCLRQFHEQEQTVTRRSQMSLVTALVLSRHSQASMPRDKIYAVTHLSHDGTRLVDTPNYFQLDNVVFQGFTENIINKQGHAAVLLLACGLGSRPTETCVSHASIRIATHRKSTSVHSLLSLRHWNQSNASLSPVTHHPRRHRSGSSVSSYTSAVAPDDEGPDDKIQPTNDASPTPSWTPRWSALDHPLPPWIIDSVLDNEKVTGVAPYLSCAEGKLVVRGAQLAIVQALSGCQYQYGTMDAITYKADHSEARYNVAIHSPQSADKVAINLWQAVVQINDPTAFMNHTKHNCDKQLCQAQNVVGYGLARILTSEHRSAPDAQSNEAVIDRWVGNNGHLQLGEKTLRQWMEEICERGRNLAIRSSPASFSGGSQTSAECSSDFATESRLFAKGLRTLEKYKMRLAFTTAGTFEAVYREAKVRDLIYRLEQVSLPVVLRQKMTEDHTSFRYIGEVYLRDHLSPSAFYTHHTWRDVDTDEHKFRPITID